MIQVPSFCIVNLLCCGGHFSSITFIDAKTKYRSPDLMDIFQSYLENHIRTSLGLPQDISERRRASLLELQIRPYGNVLVTSLGDVIKTLAGDVPWRYI